MSELKNGTKSSKVDWKMVKLGEVCEVNQRTYSLSEEWSFINYLDTGSVTENHIQQIQYLDSQNDKIPSRARRKVIKDSILYSTVRPNQRHYAILREIPENFLVSTGFAVIDANPSLANAKFLYYVLTQDSVVDYFQITAEQSVSTYPSLNPSDIMGLTISLPPLAIQRKIVAVLGALDDKIENNRKICANLEAQAQALFKSWFVDDSKDIVCSKKVEDFFDVTIGRTPPRKEFEWFSEKLDGNVVWVSIADMGSCGVFVADSSEYLTEEAIRNFKYRLVPKGTVLLSFKLTVGRVAIADVDLVTNEAIAQLRTNDVLMREYLYCYLKHFDYDKLGSTSSIATAVNSTTIREMPFLVPKEEKLKEFHDIVSPIFETIRVVQIESRALAEMRDALLPKLMSGEIDVSEVVV